MPGSIAVRRFDSRDQQNVCQLILAIMSAEFPDVGPAYPIDDIQNISSHYNAPGETFFVAEKGDVVIGTAAIKKEDGRTALLRRLFVSKDFRGKKVGRKLLDTALGFCDDVGYEEVIFKATSRMQAAISLLQQNGFSQRAKVELGDIELVKLARRLSSGEKKLRS